ncbi:lipocalin family protein [Lactobacillus corticis]|uniref:AttH domain-containing protein n=1 Tax=Lactobacillus corticis TaxID=2201249 RepID=A0A916QKA0_9LACO|nr:lipocalin family protein [Lactobacillus corticis]GFZ27378.1 hypothetical protein LCB40_12580 [Lactobacillus corticis]
MSTENNYKGFKKEAWPAVDPAAELPYHKGKYQLESWFIVSNLLSNDQKLSLQVHTGVVQKGPQRVATLNVSITNLTTGWYKQYDFIFPDGMFKLDEERFSLKTKDLTFEGDLSGFTCKVNLKDAAIDLTTTRAYDDPVLQVCGNSYVHFIGEDQYDYGIPAMATRGTITIEGTQYPITDGTTWFDRQYGKMPATLADQDQMASTNWLWMNIVLDSGVVVVPFQCTQFDNKKMEIHCTVMYPDGSHVLAVMKPIEASHRWVSPATGHSYPTRFKIELPYNNSVLNVSVVFKEAEIISKVTGIKYEGTAEVDGIFDGKKVTGNTFVELVGDWSK